MKTQITRKIMAMTMLVCAGSGAGCFAPGDGAVAPSAGSATKPGGGSGGSAGGSGVDVSGSGTSASAGPSTVSSSVANVNNIYYRIQNALTLPQPNPSATPNAPLVSYLAKNFTLAVGQQASNLSGTSNPLSASGAGSIPLLAFAACTDVNPTSYSVTGTLTAAPTAAQQTAIVNAGTTIVNQCTANLAASGTSLNSQVASVFTTQLAASPTGTTAAQAFVSVCTAATTFCVAMTGY